MGRPAYPRGSAGPGLAPPRCRARGALAVACGRSPLPPSASGATLQTRLGRALSSSGIAAANTSAIVLNLKTGQARLPAQRRPRAPARVEPEARRDARRAGGARAALPHPDARVRRGHAGRRRLARPARLKGYGDPTLARDDLKKLAREVKSRGHPPSDRPHRRATSRSSTRAGPPRAGSRRTTRRSARRSRRSSSAAASRTAASSTDPALMTAHAFRTALEARRRGRHARRHEGRSQARPRRGSPTSYSPPIMVLVKRMNLDSDNFFAEMLLKELGARARHARAARRRAPSSARVLKTAACRSPAYGSATAPASPGSTAGRPRGSPSCAPPGATRGISPIFFDSLAGRRRSRDARRPDGERARARRGAREDRHDERRLRALRLREAAVRLLDPPERLARSGDGRPRSQDRFAQILAGAAGSRAMNRTAFAVDIAVKAALARPPAVCGHLARPAAVRGQGDDRRALAYPISTLIVPVAWWLVQRRPRPPGRRIPYALDILLVAPFLIDTLGNAFDLYDSIGWWDDAEPLRQLGAPGRRVRPAPPAAAARPLEVARPRGRLRRVTAILWELGEYFTFIHSGSEAAHRLRRHARRPGARARPAPASRRS